MWGNVQPSQGGAQIVAVYEGWSYITYWCRLFSPPESQPGASTRSVAMGSSMLLFGGAMGKERLNDMHWLGPAAADPSRLEWSRAVASGPGQPSGSIS